MPSGLLAGLQKAGKLGLEQGIARRDGMVAIAYDRASGTGHERGEVILVGVVSTAVQDQYGHRGRCQNFLRHAPDAPGESCEGEEVRILIEFGPDAGHPEVRILVPAALGEAPGLIGPPLLAVLLAVGAG